MPVRKFTHVALKVIGKFPSRKMGRIIGWGSQLERDYVYLLETDPEVLSFQEQSLRILYNLDGKRSTHTPDLLIARRGRNRQQIVAVKNKKKAESPEYQSIFREVHKVCQRMGYEFVVETEAEIRVEPKLANTKLLFKYSGQAHVPVPDDSLQPFLRQRMANCA